MPRQFFFSLSLLCGMGAIVADAQTPTPTRVPAATTAKPATADQAAPENPELAAIRKTSEAFVEAFNKADAKGIAQLWAKEGEYVDESGQVTVGRLKIEELYQTFLASHPKMQIKVQIDSLRLLSDQTAIEDGRSMLSPSIPGAPAFSRYTAIHVKEGGSWKMASVRDLPTANPAARRQLADLDWLVGKWVAEEHGSVSESVFEWTAGRSFLKRTYTVTHPDRSVTSGIQIIGYSPLTEQIQSWNFGSDGSVAIGIWTSQPNGWAAAVRGLTVEGTPTFAVNLLTRIDDQAQSWKSIERRIGDVPLADTPEIILKRQPAPGK